jgi:hypothetical protein
MLVEKDLFFNCQIRLNRSKFTAQQRMRMRKEEQVDKEKIKRDREEKRWESKGICRIFLFVHMKESNDEEKGVCAPLKKETKIL